MPAIRKRGWKDPFYQYELPKRKLVIDVTRSIPPHTNEMDCLSDVEANYFHPRGVKKVLDFGAGKLRNARYLLKKGYRVWAVEYKEARETPAGTRIYAAVERKYPKFLFLQYPDEFLGFHEEADAVMLINVVNVVPEESDRKKILRECVRRLKSGGLLLWMTQYGQVSYGPGYADRLRVNDGWAYNLGKQYQTFYKSYDIPDIMSLVPLSQFASNKRITSQKHLAYMFEKR